MRTVNSPNRTGRSLRNHSRRNGKFYSSLKSTVYPKRGKPFGSYKKPSSYGGEPSQGRIHGSQQCTKPFGDGMINFLCASTMCLQQYLGVGFVVTSSADTLIYSNFKTVYACKYSGPSFNCREGNRITSSTDYTDPFRY